MNCPVCDAKLRAAEKQGVEVDICPDCKGIWLDRGELEKLIELAANDGPVRHQSPERPVERQQVYEDDRRRHDDDHHGRDRDHDRGHGQQGGHQRRRGSWLGEILGSLGGED